MATSQSTGKYDLQTLRKKYPRVGLRWTEEEDVRLQARYQEYKKTGSADFSSFLTQLVQEFGRAKGGLIVRLANFFSDVPGFNYEQHLQRVQTAEEELSSFLNSEDQNRFLDEYKSYAQNKGETYANFIARMEIMFGGVPRKVLRHTLKRRLEKVVVYKKEDLLRVSNTRKKPGPEAFSEIDYSNNPESLKALQIMQETKQNLFLTGEAGTGKSTLLQYFRSRTEKNVVVLAPTGVSALNVQGQTIHSFCGFGPDITVKKVKKLNGWSPKKKLLEKLDTIVIDEISMVRADLLDCVDKFLRLNSKNSTVPFGGYQMIFIGDLYQLPPVDKDFLTQKKMSETQGLFEVEGDMGGESSATSEASLYASPYFFDSGAFKKSVFDFVQLKEIYRQQDQVFVDILNAVRNNALSQEHLTILNRRALPEGREKFAFEQYAVYLTTTNARAKQVNNFFLDKLDSPSHRFSGTAKGSFEDRELPTDLELEAKVGAQVMMLNNDQNKRWVNGTMGKIVAVESSARPTADADFTKADNTRPTSLDEWLNQNLPERAGGKQFYVHDNAPSLAKIIKVELENGEVVCVEPYTWEMFKFTLDSKTQSIDSQVTGSFTQYPFKLAWAVTIHKAQGKTFNKVYIDLATGTFAHGQLYVALSRCRTLEGVFLKRPIKHSDILLDDRVVEFVKNL